MKRRQRKSNTCPKCGGELIKQPSMGDDYIWYECHNMKESLKTLESKYCGWRGVYKK